MTDLSIGPEYLVPEHGNITPVPWGEVTVGHIVRDQNDRLWTVLRDEQGWILIESHTGERKPMRKPDAARQAWIYVPSEQECINLLTAELGARVLREIEARERTLAKIPHFRYDPVERTAVSLKDHMSWMHNAELNDQLNEYNRVKKTRPGTPEGKAEKKQRLEEIIQELCDAHDDMHANPTVWPMSLPHHHSLEA